MWPSNTEDVPHKSGDVLGDVCKWPTTQYTPRGTYSVNLPKSVRNLEERDMGKKWKSPKLGLTIAEDTQC